MSSGWPTVLGKFCDLFPNLCAWLGDESDLRVYSKYVVGWMVSWGYGDTCCPGCICAAVVVLLFGWALEIIHSQIWALQLLMHACLLVQWSIVYLWYFPYINRGGPMLFKWLCEFISCPYLVLELVRCFCQTVKKSLHIVWLGESKIPWFWDSKTRTCAYHHRKGLAGE
jgi:hypothetical protein